VVARAKNQVNDPLDAGSRLLSGSPFRRKPEAGSGRAEVILNRFKRPCNKDRGQQ